MPDNALDRDMFRVDTIGECKIDSPLRGTKVHFTSDEGLVLVDKHFSELSTMNTYHIFIVYYDIDTVIIPFYS